MALEYQKSGVNGSLTSESLASCVIVIRTQTPRALERANIRMGSENEIIFTSADTDSHDGRR
jgi:hypothetical protein